MTCTIDILERGLISASVLLKHLKELISVIKGCLTDDFAPDLRLLSCVLLERILFIIKDGATDEDIHDLYPVMIERLDDSQDDIRIQVSKALKLFISCKLYFSPSTFEYIVKAVLIHLDDENEQIQLAIFDLLKEMAHHNGDLVLNEAKAAVKKQRYPRRCQELIKIIEKE